MRINHQIRIPTIRLLDANGKMIGITSTSEALKIAQDSGLDLVEIDPNQRPPICKVMDYGKFKYNEEKKQKELRKQNKTLPTKEVQFSPNVEENDVQIKVRKIREFIADGHKVKITMRFRGRELAHVDLGKKTFESIISGLSDVSKIETRTEFNNNTLNAMISPLK